MIPLRTKSPAVAVLITFNFSGEIGWSETISSATVSAALWSGTDSAANLISGSAAISGAIVTQLIAGGISGNMYMITCAITTSAGQVLTMEGIQAVNQNPV